MRAILVIFTSLYLAGIALAGPADRETLVRFEAHQVRPLALPGDVLTFARDLGLEEPQQDIADMRYQSYIESLKEVVDQSSEREESLRERLNGILQGRYRADPAELMQLRIDLEQSKAENWPEVDAQFDSLVEDLVAISPSQNAKAIAIAKFHLNRRVYLAPLRLEARDSNYAGEGLDLYVLVLEGRDHELSSVSQEAIQPHLDAWRKALKTKLRSNAEAERAAAMADRVAGLNQDTQARIQIMIDRSRRWSDRQLIDYNAFVGIYGACTSTDDAAIWTARYRQATYPWLWKDQDEVERIAEWMIKNGSTEQIEVVDEILPGYIARRDELRLDAEGILADGRRVGANLCSDACSSYDGAREPLTRLMHNSGQRSVLMRQARAQLEQPLSDGQRAAIIRVLLGR